MPFDLTVTVTLAFMPQCLPMEVHALFRGERKLNLKKVRVVVALG